MPHPAKCKKHPETNLEIRYNKKGSPYVACPVCKPEIPPAEAAAPPTPAPVKKPEPVSDPSPKEEPHRDNGNPKPVKWYEKPVF